MEGYVKGVLRKELYNKMAKHCIGEFLLIES